MHPQFLPDGRHFLFYARGTGGVRGIYVSSIDGSEQQTILNGDFAAPALVMLRQLLFVRQGKLFAQPLDRTLSTLVGTPSSVVDRIAVNEGNVAALAGSPAGVIVYRAASPTPIRQFVWFDRAGNAIAKVGDPETAHPTELSLSPDGRTMAMHRVQGGNVDIWLLDVSRGTLSRFTTNEAREADAVWSPDGLRIAFNIMHDGTLDLQIKDLRGGVSRDLLADGQSRSPTDWSADGKFLLYDTYAAGSSDIWALSMDGNGKPFPVIQTPFDERRAHLSPDGHWIAYESDESGRFEIYVQPFGRSGERQRLSTTGGGQTVWGRNGRELFYIAPDGWLMAVPIAKVPDGERLQAGPPARLFRTAVGGEPPAERQYVVSTDGKRFLMNTVIEATAAPITVISNWKPPGTQAPYFGSK
jgi:Tol biopolymer transport system component